MSFLNDSIVYTMLEKRQVLSRISSEYKGVFKEYLVKVKTVVTKHDAALMYSFLANKKNVSRFKVDVLADSYCYDSQTILDAAPQLNKKDLEDELTTLCSGEKRESYKLSLLKVGMVNSIIGSDKIKSTYEGASGVVDNRSLSFKDHDLILAYFPPVYSFCGSGPVFTFASKDYLIGWNDAQDVLEFFKMDDVHEYVLDFQDLPSSYLNIMKSGTSRLDFSNGIQVYDSLSRLYSMFPVDHSNLKEILSYSFDGEYNSYEDLRKDYREETVLSGSGLSFEVPVISADSIVEIYSLNGNLVANIRFGDIIDLHLNLGIYIIKYGSHSFKIKFPLDLSSDGLYYYELL